MSDDSQRVADRAVAAAVEPVLAGLAAELVGVTRGTRARPGALGGQVPMTASSRCWASRGPGESLIERLESGIASLYLARWRPVSFQNPTMR